MSPDLPPPARAPANVDIGDVAGEVISVVQVEDRRAAVEGVRRGEPPVQIVAQRHRHPVAMGQRVLSRPTATVRLTGPAAGPMRKAGLHFGRIGYDPRALPFHYPSVIQ